MPKLSSTASYFDGRSAQPTEGVLHLEGDSLQFVPYAPKQAPITIPLCEILHLSDIGGKKQIERKPLSAAEPGHTLLVTDPSFVHALEQALTRSHTVSGWDVKLAWHKTHWCILLACLLLALPLVYLLVIGLSTQAYRLVSPDQEKKLGELAYHALVRNFDVCEDKVLLDQLQQWVDDLSDPSSPYTCEVTVVKADDANACALPGGHIVVFSGLLQRCDTANALAGVLAHELVHIEQRHSLKQLGKSLGTFFFIRLIIGAGFEDMEQLELAEGIGELISTLIVLKYSRNAESEADELAIAKLHTIQQSVTGLAQFLSTLDREPTSSETESTSEENSTVDLKRVTSWISTHPATTERVRKLEATVKAEPPGLSAVELLSADDWDVMRKGCAL